MISGVHWAVSRVLPTDLLLAPPRMILEVLDPRHQAVHHAVVVALHVQPATSIKSFSSKVIFRVDEPPRELDKMCVWRGVSQQN